MCEVLHREARAHFLAVCVNARCRSSLRISWFEEWIAGKYRVHAEWNRILTACRALDVVDDAADTAKTLRLVEMSPRRQRHKVDWIDAFARSDSAANLSLRATIAPPPDEDLLAQKRASTVNTWPLGASGHKSFLHALSKNVSKAILFGVLANHDEGGATKDRPVSPEHGVHCSSNV